MTHRALLVRIGLATFPSCPCRLEPLGGYHEAAGRSLRLMRINVFVCLACATVLEVADDYHCHHVYHLSNNARYRKKGS